MKLLRKKPRRTESESQSVLARRRIGESGFWPVPGLLEHFERAFDRIRRPWADWNRDWFGLAMDRPLIPEFESPALKWNWNWPAMDFAEDEKNVTITLDVPGLDEKDLDVQISGNLMTVRGSREDEFSEKRLGVVRRERVSGNFSRSITLPSYVDTAKAEARYNKGTLTITFPKFAGKGPKRVPVRAG